MKKIKALWALLQAGKMVNDPAKWKKRQISASAITVVLWSALEAAKVYGYDLAISEEVVDSVAVAILGIVNFVLTVTTTEKIGLSPQRDSDS